MKRYLLRKITGEEELEKSSDQPRTRSRVKHNSSGEESVTPISSTRKANSKSPLKSSSSKIENLKKESKKINLKSKLSRNVNKKDNSESDKDKDEVDSPEVEPAQDEAASEQNLQNPDENENNNSQDNLKILEQENNETEAFKQDTTEDVTQNEIITNAPSVLCPNEIEQQSSESSEDDEDNVEEESQFVNQNVTLQLQNKDVEEPSGQEETSEDPRSSNDLDISMEESPGVSPVPRSIFSVRTDRSNVFVHFQSSYRKFGYLVIAEDVHVTQFAMFLQENPNVLAWYYKGLVLFDDSQPCEIHLSIIHKLHDDIRQFNEIRTQDPCMPLWCSSYSLRSISEDILKAPDMTVTHEQRIRDQSRAPNMVLEVGYDRTISQLHALSFVYLANPNDILAYLAIKTTYPYNVNDPKSFKAVAMLYIRRAQDYMPIDIVSFGTEPATMLTRGILAEGIGISLNSDLMRGYGFGNAQPCTNETRDQYSLRIPEYALTALSRLDVPPSTPTSTSGASNFFGATSSSSSSSTSMAVQLPSTGEPIQSASIPDVTTAQEPPLSQDLVIDLYELQQEMLRAFGLMHEQYLEHQEEMGVDEESNEMGPRFSMDTREQIDHLQI